jgi:hypothetical protein
MVLKSQLEIAVLDDQYFDNNWYGDKILDVLEIAISINFFANLFQQYSPITAPPTSSHTTARLVVLSLYSQVY